MRLAELPHLLLDVLGKHGDDPVLVKLACAGRARVELDELALETLQLRERDRAVEREGDGRACCWCGPS